MDEDSLRDFVRTRLPRLSRVAYLLTSNHHAAEDLLQSALIKLATKWNQVRKDGNPDAYLRRILYNEHISIWRRGRHEQSYAEVPEPASASDDTENSLRRIVIEQALAKLTPRQRAVIVLRFFEDLSEVDTAEAMNCSVGTVKSQTHHALNRLRLLAPELITLTNDSIEVLI